MKTQLKIVKELHLRDLEREYAGVFLVNALKKKYKNAAKEFIWQWLFPAVDLTRVPETAEYKRYHLHETVVQRTLKEAVGKKTALYKRATAIVFVTVLPATYCRLMLISVPFRSCLDIAT